MATSRSDSNMSKVVYKYHLAVEDMQRVVLPKEAEILCVQVVADQLCLYAIVDPDNETEGRLMYQVYSVVAALRILMSQSALRSLALCAVKLKLNNLQQYGNY